MILDKIRADSLSSLEKLSEMQWLMLVFFGMNFAHCHFLGCWLTQHASNKALNQMISPSEYCLDNHITTEANND